MEFDTIASGKALRADYEPHFQGPARWQRFASAFGDRPSVFAVHFDAGDVDEGDWAGDY